MILIRHFVCVNRCHSSFDSKLEVAPFRISKELLDFARIPKLNVQLFVEMSQIIKSKPTLFYLSSIHFLPPNS